MNDNKRRGFRSLAAKITRLVDKSSVRQQNHESDGASISGSGVVSSGAPQQRVSVVGNSASVVNSSQQVDCSRLDDLELNVITKLYAELVNRSSTTKPNGIDRSTFIEYFQLPGLWGERLFRSFARGQDSVNYEAFVHGLSVCCRGTKSERVGVLFKLFDLNDDGVVSKDELTAMLSNVPYLDTYLQSNKPVSRTQSKSIVLQDIPAHDQVPHDQASQSFTAGGEGQSEGDIPKNNVHSSDSRRSLASAGHHNTFSSVAVQAPTSGPVLSSGPALSSGAPSGSSSNNAERKHVAEPPPVGDRVGDMVVVVPPSGRGPSLEKPALIESSNLNGPEEMTSSNQSSCSWLEDRHTDLGSSNEDGASNFGHDRRVPGRDERIPGPDHRGSGRASSGIIVSAGVPMQFVDGESEDTKDLIPHDGRLEETGGRAGESGRVTEIVYGGWAPWEEESYGTQSFPQGGPSDDSEVEDQDEDLYMVGPGPSPMVTEMLARVKRDVEVESEINDLDALVSTILDQYDTCGGDYLDLDSFRLYVDHHNGLLKLFSDCLREDVWSLKGHALSRQQPPVITDIKKLENWIGVSKQFQKAAPRQASLHPVVTPVDCKGLQEGASGESSLGHSPSGEKAAEGEDGEDVTAFLGLKNKIHRDRQTQGDKVFDKSATSEQKRRHQTELNCPSCLAPLVVCPKCNGRYTTELKLENEAVYLRCRSCRDSRFNDCWVCGFRFSQTLQSPTSEILIEGNLFTAQGTKLHCRLVDRLLYYFETDADKVPSGFIFLEGCYVEPVKSVPAAVSRRPGRSGSGKTLKSKGTAVKGTDTKAASPPAIHPSGVQATVGPTISGHAPAPAGRGASKTRLGVNGMLGGDVTSTSLAAAAGQQPPSQNAVTGAGGSSGQSAHQVAGQTVGAPGQSSVRAAGGLTPSSSVGYAQASTTTGTVQSTPAGADGDRRGSVQKRSGVILAASPDGLDPVVSGSAHDVANEAVTQPPRSSTEQVKGQQAESEAAGKKEGNSADSVMYGFQILPERRVFFAENEQSRNSWIQAIRCALSQQPINDLYDMLETIGHGKFSVVYRAIERATSDSVAIKVVHKNRMSCQEKDLLRSELNIMRMLRHPHVIYLKTVVSARDSLYIVMEIVPGGELFEAVTRQGPIAETAVHRLTVQLLKTLAYLHKSGIVHRDLKPENILLTSKDVLQADVKIADFGLSCLCGPNELLKQPCGTLVYAAPEVLTMKGYNHKVDLWSLGVVVYLLLCGKLPFPVMRNIQTLNDLDSFYKVKYDSPPWNNVSRTCQDFVSKLLVVNPENRASSQEALNHIWIKNPTAVIGE